MSKIFNKLEKKIRYQKLKTNLKHINDSEEKIQLKPDSYFQERTQELQQYLESGFKVEAILPEAFALVREATNRVLGIRQYDVQILGGISLFYGYLTEMKTGEGKTFVTLFPAYLNALMGKHTHVVTANQYLAKRDYETLTKVFNFLGIKTGIVFTSESYIDKQNAYDAFVSFGTIFDFIFDYLNNNLAKDPKTRINFPFDNIILDEADSILIDDARRPVNITGSIEGEKELYHLFNEISKQFEGYILKEEDMNKKFDFLSYDYLLNPKNKMIDLTEKGFKKLEKILVNKNILADESSIYITENLRYVNFLYGALRANYVLRKDVDYIIDEKDNSIVLVDETSGRPEKGSRWGDGLHQAVEAKENVEIKPEANVKATITIQNFIKLYENVSGMTGTAQNDEEEFKDLYNLNVCVIPTNKPIIRNDLEDIIYEKKKYVLEAILQDIQEQVSKRRPVLIGTPDVSTSELVSNYLIENNITHNVLNAKNHSREAHIIAQAGKPSVVTVATSMAGRGTDIVLGGNKDIEVKNFLNSGLTQEQAINKWQEEHNKVIKAGGLHIIGIERNDSRRLDNQLIGRSGRQGDPGSTVFYLSLEDRLLKIFGEPIQALWQSLNLNKGGISHKFISKTILNGQKKIEGGFFSQRKYLLQYDSVNGEQREIIYALRDEILKSENLEGLIASYINFSCKILVEAIFGQENFKEKEKKQIQFVDKLKSFFNFQVDFSNFCKEHKIDNNIELIAALDNYIYKQYTQKMDTVAEDAKILLDRNLFLSTIDNLWEEHISFLNSLRKNSDLSSNAQENPITNYKRDALDYFRRLIEQTKIDYVSSICHFSPFELLEKIENENREIQKNNAKNKIYDINNKKEFPDMFLDYVGV